MSQNIPRQEIEKWLNKIEPLIDNIQILDPRGENMLRNMKAYISDCKHFLEKEDFMRSFEAVIWAWAIYEICSDLDIFKKNVE